MEPDCSGDAIGRIAIRLLGPLEVVVDGRVIDLGSARQRVILSMLALEANRIVPLGRLVDAVWDDMPPATARSQIHTCVSALRRCLAAASLDVIVTRSVGYIANLPDDAVDIAKFERLVTRGRAAAAERPADAVADLRAALSLWVGAAATGVDSRLVQAAATRLNETRLSVLEECVDLELALGRHQSISSELGELTTRYPLRERLRARYMLALYRSGRQAEALESFREGRQILRDELGLDPCDELCELEGAILANDRSLDLDVVALAHPARVDARAAGVPRQLPAAVADFTGRDDVLATLTKLLRGSDRGASATRSVRLVTINGKGGVGKTALALEAAHALRQHYPDGQLFAQLREAGGQPVSPMDILARFLKAFGMVPTAMPDTLAERTAVYRSLLGDRRVMIFLDDAESESQVLPLIPGNPECSVVITSRTRLSSLQGADHIELGDIDERTATELLGNIIGPERVTAEISSAASLVRLCGYLPLALRIVAAKLASRPHWTIEQMVRRMTDEGKRLDELALSGAGMRATLALSFDGLSGAGKQLFLLLGMLGTVDFASWVTGPLLDAETAITDDVLAELVEASLVEVRVSEDGSHRLRLHELTRIYAVERLAIDVTTAERSAALRRLLGCWLFLATEAHRRKYGGDFAVLHGTGETWTPPTDVVDRLLEKPLDWFRAEHAGLVSAILDAGHTGLHELCWDLAMTSVTLFESEFQVADWRRTHEVALDACRRVGNRRGEAAMLFSLGNLAVGERPADASRYLEKALNIFGAIGEQHGSALTVGMLAYVDRLGGHYDQALARYREALTRFRAVGDLVGEVDSLTSMAQIETDRENFPVVRQLLDEAAMICRTLGSPRTTAQTEYRLGHFFLRTGNLEQAERSFRYVLEIVREESDVVGESSSLLGLGTVRTRRGMLSQAEDDLRAALDLARRLGDKLLHGRALLTCAEHYLTRNELVQARSLIDEALVVFSELEPAAVWRARFLELKARIDERTGRPAAAAAGRKMALDLVSDLDPALARALRSALAAGRPAGDEGRTAHGPSWPFT
jgi:DNA-binding SARP family transcriptional activator/tetratricopeptide (TPR) repeat protein